MKRNMGNIDRAIRLALVVGIAGLYFGNLISGTLAIVGLVVGGILLLTSMVNFCPLYAVLGVRTCPVEK